MPFKNRVRLPFRLNKPQFPETRNVYRRADGVTKVQSVVIRKVYQGQTDWWPAEIHEKFKIAIAHDTTTVETDVYLGDISQDGDYTINWPENNYPAATANFKAEVSPFNATNSNCQTCEEAVQISLVDDTYPGPLAEGSTTDLNVISNDDICCYPVTFSIVYYNTDVVGSASISPEGIVTIGLNSPLSDYNNLKLATYRATCPNGGYDEADIYADITGSTEGCLAPLGVAITDLTTDSATFSWSAPSPAPLAYHYQLYDAANMGAPVYEGDVGGPPLNFGFLTPGTNYKFFIAGLCAEGVQSNYVETDFTTLATSAGSCGKYAATYVDPSRPMLNSTVTYYDCAGNLQADPMVNGVQRIICVLETSPGTPVELIITNPYGTGSVSYFYIEPC